jgi:hypothetical protein
LLLITCSNYELETRLIKPEIRFPKVKNMGSIETTVGVKDTLVGEGKCFLKLTDYALRECYIMFSWARHFPEA